MDDEHILQLRESFQTDESIRRYEYQEYQPITGANINAAGEIRIIIESQDEIFHPAQSFLLVEGQLVKGGAAAGAYADADEISLVNNGIMYLFQNIRYELSGHEIESLNHPGPATTMKGLLRYSDDFTKCQGMNQCWIKDQGEGTAKSDKDNLGFMARHDYIIEKPTPKGSFSFVIPLNHVFGFADDYDKVLYGLRNVLTERIQQRCTISRRHGGFSGWSGKPIKDFMVYAASTSKRSGKAEIYENNRIKGYDSSRFPCPSM